MSHGVTVRSIVHVYHIHLCIRFSFQLPLDTVNFLTLYLHLPYQKWKVEQELDNLVRQSKRIVQKSYFTGMKFNQKIERQGLAFLI